MIKRLLFATLVVIVLLFLMGVAIALAEPVSETVPLEVKPIPECSEVPSDICDSGECLCLIPDPTGYSSQVCVPCSEVEQFRGWWK